VILFDEIEKAHPDIYHIFLQMFDDGRLTDSHGQTADFSQTIILLTSNLGMRDVDQAKLKGLPSEKQNDYLREVCEAAVKRHFAPEFLNRLDELIIMNFLTAETVTRIAEIQLTGVLEQLARRGKTADVTRNAFDLIVREGYNPEYGARFLNRAIESLVLKPMAKFLLENPGSTRIRVGTNEHGIAIETVTG
jgi:ATP-dependent Clp protease ATP-binding subunit ClpA